MYVIKVYCFMSVRGVVALASRGAFLKSVDPGPASSVSPGYLLELQLSITPDLLTQELGLEPENGFTRAPGDSEGCSSWRITAASKSSCQPWLHSGGTWDSRAFKPVPAGPWQFRSECAAGARGPWWEGEEHGLWSCLVWFEFRLCTLTSLWLLARGRWPYLLICIVRMKMIIPQDCHNRQMSVSPPGCVRLTVSEWGLNVHGSSGFSVDTCAATGKNEAATHILVWDSIGSIF